MSMPSSHDQVVDRSPLETDLESLFSLSLGLLGVIGRDHYLRRFNLAWTELLGFTDQELRGEVWYSRLHPDDQLLASRQIQQLLQEMPMATHSLTLRHQPRVSFEARHVAKDGIYKNFLWQATTCPYRQQVYIIARELKTPANVEDSCGLMIQNVADYGIYMLHTDGSILSWNKGAERIYGYLRDDVMGQSVAVLYSPEEKAAGKPKAELQSAIAAGYLEGEFYRVRSDGSSFWIRETTTLVRKQDGTVCGLLRMAQDVTERKEAEAKLAHSAFHDALTGLPNIAMFKTALGHALEFSQKNPNYLFAVLFLDLDRFKTINDSLGHWVGDQLLVEVAQRLRQCLRAGDLVARFGGDEFAILLENVAGVKQAIEVAERIRQSLTLPIRVNEHEVYTSSSIGIALNTIKRDQVDAFLRDADTAMYRAKSLGRGRYEVFNEGMRDRTLKLLQLENDLRHALERGEFQLNYQPIVPLRSDKPSGFEALLRWYHPTRGLISPAEFIPLAEETGLIVSIGHWVLQEACHQLCRWQREFSLSSNFYMSVNFSGRQFEQPEVVAKIQQILQESCLQPHQLKLEITESVILANADLVAHMLLQLQKLGVRVSIDDFGTGYSSLSYLHSFPIDTIKIDASFVNRVDIDGSKLELVSTIIKLAWNLGMDVVAEGVELSTQLAQLKVLQCDSVQGYLFSRPMDSQMAAKWLANWSKNGDREKP